MKFRKDISPEKIMKRGKNMTARKTKVYRGLLANGRLQGADLMYGRFPMPLAYAVYVIFSSSSGKLAAAFVRMMHGLF